VNLLIQQSSTSSLKTFFDRKRHLLDCYNNIELVQELFSILFRCTAVVSQRCAANILLWYKVHGFYNFKSSYTPQSHQKRGGWGGPSRPTFCGKICHYSKSSQSTLGSHASLVPCNELRCAHGRASLYIHVVNINHVFPLIAGLCEFSSTFVFLSDRDVFVSTASTRDW